MSSSTAPPPDGLRSTRRGSVDRRIFPTLAAWHDAEGFPHVARLRVSSRYAWLTLDGAMWRDRNTGPQLGRVYRQYLDWWLERGSPQRRTFPRRGIGHSPECRDYVCLTVLREHAPWWIALLDELAHALPTRDEYRATRFVPLSDAVVAP